MNDRPIIDPQAIARLQEWGGAELPRKMIDIFLSHSPERMEQIREGLSTRTAKKVETGAHSLKSSAGNVGAVRLQALAQTAEGVAEEGDLATLEGMLPDIEKAFEEACTELKTIMEGMDG